MRDKRGRFAAGVHGSDEANVAPERKHPANRRELASQSPPDIHVWICDKHHPHFGERGVMTGKIIRLFGTLMAEICLDHCQHGTDGCFVQQGQIREDRRA